MGLLKRQMGFFLVVFFGIFVFVSEAILAEAKPEVLFSVEGAFSWIDDKVSGKYLMKGTKRTGFKWSPVTGYLRNGRMSLELAKTTEGRIRLVLSPQRRTIGQPDESVFSYPLSYFLAPGLELPKEIRDVIFLAELAWQSQPLNLVLQVRPAIAEGERFVTKEIRQDTRASVWKQWEVTKVAQVRKVRIDFVPIEKDLAIVDSVVKESVAKFEGAIKNTVTVSEVALGDLPEQKVESEYWNSRDLDYHLR